jgi:hypothetical protein
VLTDLRADENRAWQQFRTARLDPVSMVNAASRGIHQALRAAQDHRGELDPVLVDIDLVERHRDDFGLGLDNFEEESGGRPAYDTTDEEYVRRRRARFGQLPRRISPAEMVELVEPNPIRETHEPAEPRREWA